MLAAIAFSLWLVGIHDNNQYTLYRIRFDESVSGLDIDGPVKFCGVQVGKVKAMSIDPADMRLIRVDVSILKTTPIKTDTVASLKLQGITGVVYIELSGTTPEAPNMTSNNNDLPEIPAQPSTLNAIMDMLPEILQKVSHIADQADKLFSDKNIAALSKTFGNIQKASSNAKEATQEIKENPTKLIFSPKKKEESKP
jgi:phospholipid/cholesterol/gamma-HCH transport system substrate-binding protein